MAMEEEKMAAAKGGLEELEKKCRSDLNQFKVITQFLVLEVMLTLFPSQLMMQSEKAAWFLKNLLKQNKIVFFFFNNFCYRFA